MAKEILDHVLHSAVMSPQSPLLRNSSIVFYDIEFFEEYRLAICRLSLNLGLSNVSSGSELGVNFC